MDKIIKRTIAAQFPCCCRSDVYYYLLSFVAANFSEASTRWSFAVDQTYPYGVFHGREKITGNVWNDQADRFTANTLLIGIWREGSLLRLIYIENGVKMGNAVDENGASVDINLRKVSTQTGDRWDVILPKDCATKVFCIVLAPGKRIDLENYNLNDYKFGIVHPLTPYGIVCTPLTADTLIDSKATLTCREPNDVYFYDNFLRRQYNAYFMRAVPLFGGGRGSGDTVLNLHDGNQPPDDVSSSANNTICSANYEGIQFGYEQVKNYDGYGDLLPGHFMIYSAFQPARWFSASNDLEIRPNKTEIYMSIHSQRGTLDKLPQQIAGVRAAERYGIHPNIRYTGLCTTWNADVPFSSDGRLSDAWILQQKRNKTAPLPDWSGDYLINAKTCSAKKQGVCLYKNGDRLYFCYMASNGRGHEAAEWRDIAEIPENWCSVYADQNEIINFVKRKSCPRKLCGICNIRHSGHIFARERYAGVNQYRQFRRLTADQLEIMMKPKPCYPCNKNNTRYNPYS